MFDLDRTSPTFGIGDRFYWAWKLIDFGNGTFQGAAHGLARLLASGELAEYISPAAAMARIDAMFLGAKRLRRRNGSMEEAFPYESSFCVTALVAADLLAAIVLLGDRVDRERRDHYLDVVRPMLRFLCVADETHAFISNHLATAALALYRWHALTDDAHAERRGRELLQRILDAQSHEGWFREYEGADPGYQTLCTHYLADLHRLRPDLELAEPLYRSVRFLWHFAHPDGSFGGHYGSRNTRFFYPGGIEALALECPEAAALALHMRQSIQQHRTVTLDVMDAPNLIPMFNSYCWAAALAQERREEEWDQVPTLPALEHRPARRRFHEAGLIVDRGVRHYTIISTHKGGVCYHYTEGNQRMINAGVVARARDGSLLSSQQYNRTNKVASDTNSVVVTSHLARLDKPVPTPLQFLTLRTLNLTVMRWQWIGRFVKQMLVRYLITGKRFRTARNRRTITFGADLEIHDVLDGEQRLALTKVKQPFSAIHMASHGYWQRQDDTDA